MEFLVGTGAGSRMPPEKSGYTYSLPSNAEIFNASKFFGTIIKGKSDGLLERGLE